MRNLNECLLDVVGWPSPIITERCRPCLALGERSEASYSTRTETGRSQRFAASTGALGLCRMAP
ncbi:unnamed protein product [Chondrus crispus]|uniref:Uncharacterized protein n=1 Tax=Chondrus crispus TaxID=2769 RepID=R7QJU8_CHOCR|nr:unnamed protein product [Chondrus crispus]CDF38802.1 unnamed protein product [Chondrus crispus]|eukprot:XP_005718707.1 unnamed protein product [Chondrus crispus]